MGKLSKHFDALAWRNLAGAVSLWHGPVAQPRRGPGSGPEDLPACLALATDPAGCENGTRLIHARKMLQSTLENGFREKQHALS